jgi:adenylate cyclase
MGGDSEQDYFSDGISEDIITNLAKVAALAVVARNTAFTFKGRSVNVTEVAQLLDVGHVLEGSVRKSGGRVRITAQLIEGATGTHVWAERYDRDLTDIFAVQDEIAETIVSALKLQLLPQEKAAIEQHGTLNVDAYNLYLMARDYYVRGHQGNLRRMETVIRLCGQATEIDPGYARAWTLMAWGKESLRFFFGDSGADIMAILDRSMSLEADQAEAHALRATHLLLSGKSSEAADEMNFAIRLDPDSYRVNLAAARFCFSQARFAEAIPCFEKVANLDEGNFTASTMVLACHRALGNMEGAIRSARITFDRADRALQRDQSDCGAIAAGAGALAVLGEAERARAWMKRALFMEPDSIVMRYNFACALSNDLADVDGAIELLGPTFAAISPEHLAYAKTDPDLDPIREDPRFQALVAAAEARLAEVPIPEVAGIS